MKDVKERIEGSFRLIAFRRMKRRIFLLEVVMLLILAFGLMAIMGASLNPFYMPMDYFLLMIFVLLMLLVPETQYLGLLEIAQTKSKSGKYLMARNNVRNATVVIVLCVMFVVMFALPPSVKAMESGYTVSETVYVNPGDEAVFNYTTRDSMGTRTVMDVRVYVADAVGGDLSIYLLRAEDYEAGELANRANYDFSWHEGDTLVYSSGQWHKGFEQFVIQANGTSPAASGRIEIGITYEFSEAVTKYMPLLGIIFIVVEGLTVSYFLPIREKYASSSIFSKDYVESKDSGAERLSERAAALDKALSEDEIAKEAELSETAVPMEMPVAAVEVKLGQARKKGVLEVAGAEAKDVACSTCGSMNSPDSSLCFSCGNAIEVKPTVTVGPEELMEKGRSFLSRGRNQDAIWCFDEVLKGDHKNEPALFMKAKALVGDGRRELAIQYLNTVIQLNPVNQEAHLMRGAIFEGLEMYDKATDSYEKALGIGPSELAAAKLKEMMEGDREDVINQFMTLPGIGPAKASALFDAGLTSVEALKGASLEKLCTIKGISERIAKKLLKDMGREI
ncbi:MAG: helix-hairpin-helix domain-containing protein [Methanobacteriota archaeon]